jgi:predicted lipid-binding transport protein (Tim44 family)
VDTTQYASIQHPAITDTTAFTSNAKSQYIALQAAWDAGDIAKLRNMTTDTLFMELAQQIANRKGAPNHTEVMHLHCELLDVRDEASDTVATLRFTGTAREDGAATAGFEDVWTLTKPTSTNSGWLLAGVESN